MRPDRRPQQTRRPYFFSPGNRTPRRRHAFPAWSGSGNNTREKGRDPASIRFSDTPRPMHPRRVRLKGSAPLRAVSASRGRSSGRGHYRISPRTRGVHRRHGPSSRIHAARRRWPAASARCSARFGQSCGSESPLCRPSYRRTTGLPFSPKGREKANPSPQ